MSMKRDYFHSNRYADYYCNGVPALGYCYGCDRYGPADRTCWIADICDKKDSCPPSFIHRNSDPEMALLCNFRFDEEKDELQKCIDEEEDSKHEYIFRCKICKKGWGHFEAPCDRCNNSGNLCTVPIIAGDDLGGVTRTRKFINGVDYILSFFEGSKNIFDFLKMAITTSRNDV